MNRSRPHHARCNAIMRFLLMLGWAAPASSSAHRLLSAWTWSETEPDPGAPLKGISITIPHTANATDIQAGKGTDNMGKTGYRRAPSWYAADIPAVAPGRRMFVRFGAVSSVAEVSLNGKIVGGHKGPATAFACELTPHLRPQGDNRLIVKADNTWRADVAPLSGDFGVPGGMYRPVELLEKPAVCLSPLVHGSRGVAVTQIRADKNRAELRVVAHVDRGVPMASEVVFHLWDAAGRKVASARAGCDAGAGPAVVEGRLVLEHPHLWQGWKDPYLYTLETTLTAADASRDSERTTVGFRTLTFDKDKGTLLNGEPYPLRGVNRHQDRERQSWAVTAGQEQEDVAIIREMGANAVRAAHYPHSETFLDACDQAGLLVWSELPLIDTVGAEPEKLLLNLEQQLREMIAQQRHHPSVFCWSLYNELGNRAPADAVSVVRRLHEIARAEDPSRPTTAAACRASQKNLNRITDIMAYNSYPGWYGGGSGDQEDRLREFVASAPDRPWGISEYGAGASLSHQDDTTARGPNPQGKWHPEAWQARVHEHALESISRHPELWGTFVWNMFDFASPWRTEGERDGINDKGLVTYDRKTRKDAFYLYQAHWSPTPVLHLLARRDVARTNAETVVRYYTNLTNVCVTLNGEALAQAQPYAPHAWRVDGVRLRPGKNVVEAAAPAAEGRVVTDRVKWELKAP